MAIKPRVLFLPRELVMRRYVGEFVRKHHAKPGKGKSTWH